MDTSYSKRFVNLEQYVQQLMGNAPGCHDYAHTSRVLHNARLIAKFEDINDVSVIETAALLHDISRPEEMSANGTICHAQKGADRVPGILREFGFDDEVFIADVASAVRTHRYRGNDLPQSQNEKILFDADKLDSIGAVGVGRAFHFAGHIGARVHNTEEVALDSESYSVEDSAYREYLHKLRKIPERMLTKAGKAVAEKRAEIMKLFFEQLNHEVFGDFSELT